MNLDELIDVGRGLKKSDLLLKNAKVVNVFSGDVFKTDMAIYGGKIVGFGDYQAKEIVDLDGAYLCPGFIDGHVHVESSMLTIPEFARAVVPNGTTAVVIDPHEIANVLGVAGIKYMLSSSESLPLNVYVMLPSCVPATRLETAGAELNTRALSTLLKERRVLGIAEMMNYPGVILKNPEVLEKVHLGLTSRVDGHAPGLTGKDLCAYVDAGIRSDHEITSAQEALEKLRLGMHIMIREGSAAKNLKELLKIVTPVNSRRFFFVTDDRHSSDLLKEGHINYLIKMAINQGLDPVMAIQMATINPALYFRLAWRGAVALGYHADLVVVDDLKKFNVVQVFKEGRLVAFDGKAVPFKFETPPKDVRNTIHIATLSIDSLKVKADGGKIKAIEVIPGQLTTKKTMIKPKIVDGFIVSDASRDVLKLAVVERHKATGNIGLGFVKGIGLKKGALASTVAHDSHNLIAVGTSDEEMLYAMSELQKIGGGQIVVAEGKVLAALPLPIAGLMSDKSAAEVAEAIEQLDKAAKSLGIPLNNPFMILSFLALPVIPELKLTDKGLVDVGKSEIVPLFGE